ncbi:PelD GGDEF domain-containing protein [Chitinimonas lacunae]|uniref:PelD GGDEF domain-containing protein n=1 Tax=Chitinimonas lacunae TaxID=1963018 RepID=A0ABV8MP40_9NEIS
MSRTTAPLPGRLSRLRRSLSARFALHGEVDFAWAALETLLLTLATAGLCTWLNPDDPLGRQSGWPWPWFAPWLLALRYGVSAGLFSTALLLAWWWVGQRYALAAFGEFPKLYYLGGLIATMLAGEFSGNWQIRLRRVSETNDYLYERLRRVSNNYYLVKLSHDRLEHEFLLKPTTMRDALDALKSQLARRQHSASETTEQLNPTEADAFLRLLNQFCGIEQAGYYRFPLDSPDPLAYLGANPGEEALQRLAVDDAMVRHCLERKLLTHLETEAIGRQHETAYQVVAPVLTSDDRLLGLIAVRHIGFFALHQETLLMMTALTSYLADSLAQPLATRQLLAQRPDCPADFAEELGKLALLARQAQIESWLVLQVFSHPAGNDTIEAIRRMRRGLDGVWLFPGSGQSAVLSLLPMTNAAGVDGYLQRIAKWLDDLHGGDFALQHRRVHVQPVGGRDLRELISKALSALPAELRATGVPS